MRYTYVQHMWDVRLIYWTYMLKCMSDTYVSHIRLNFHGWRCHVYPLGPQASSCLPLTTAFIRGHFPLFVYYHFGLELDPRSQAPLATWTSRICILLRVSGSGAQPSPSAQHFLSPAPELAYSLFGHDADRPVGQPALSGSSAVSIN